VDQDDLAVGPPAGRRTPAPSRQPPAPPEGGQGVLRGIARPPRWRRVIASRPAMLARPGSGPGPGQGTSLGGRDPRRLRRPSSTPAWQGEVSPLRVMAAGVARGWRVRGRPVRQGRNGRRASAAGRPPRHRVAHPRDGFTWSRPTSTRRRPRARHASRWPGTSCSGDYELLILDEITYAVAYGWSRGRRVAAVRGGPEDQRRDDRPQRRPRPDRGGRHRHGDAQGQHAYDQGIKALKASSTSRRWNGGSCSASTSAPPASRRSSSTPPAGNGRPASAPTPFGPSAVGGRKRSSAPIRAAGGDPLGASLLRRRGGIEMGGRRAGRALGDVMRSLGPARIRWLPSGSPGWRRAGRRCGGGGRWPRSSPDARRAGSETVASWSAASGRPWPRWTGRRVRTVPRWPSSAGSSTTAGPIRTVLGVPELVLFYSPVPRPPSTRWPPHRRLPRDRAPLLPEVTAHVLAGAPAEPERNTHRYGGQTLGSVGSERAAGLFPPVRAGGTVMGRRVQRGGRGSARPGSRSPSRS